MNFDSGNIASTFCTFCGLDGFSGVIASTSSFDKEHEVLSLSSTTSFGIGSVVASPQNVPDEQVGPPGAVVGAGGAAVVGPKNLHYLTLFYYKLSY